MLITTYRILNVAAAVAVPISGILNSKGVLSTNEYGLTLSIIFLYLLTREFFDNLLKRYTPAHIQNMAPAADIVLQEMLGEYFKFLQEKHITDIPEFRANVMVLHHRRSSSRTLKIVYKATPDNRIKYSAKELDIHWTNDQGVVGYVCRTKQGKILDTSDDYWISVNSNLTSDQKTQVGHLKSIICEPIFKKNKFVGTISIDCISDLSQSLFNDANVVRIVRTYARHLRPLCPTNGVTVSGN